MQKHRAVAILTVALAVVVLGSSMALADTLSLGGGYNTIYTSVDTNGIGGGSIQNSTLNGTSLPWVYCVDYYDNVGVPALYSNTFVNNGGTIAGSQTNSNNFGITGFNGTNGSQTSVNNFVAVAWLLQNFASKTVGDTNAQIGLQGAIWNQIYGMTLTNSNSNTALTDYNADLAALAALGGSVPNYVSNFDWLSPNGNDPSVMQGLVTRVPDGGMTLMLLGGTLVGLGTLRRKFHV